jgi:hypothetical protein
MSSNIPLEFCPLKINCHEASHCLHYNKDDLMDTLFRITEKVTVFALGLFAYMTSPLLFSASFAIGVLIGLFTHVNSNNCHLHKHTSEGSCSHGFIESRLGIKLPESFALLAGAAVVAEHIDHHASIFVPIAGLTFGIWAGNLIAPNLQANFRKIVLFN